MPSSDSRTDNRAPRAFTSAAPRVPATRGVISTHELQSSAARKQQEKFSPHNTHPEYQGEGHVLFCRDDTCSAQESGWLHFANRSLQAMAPMR